MGIMRAEALEYYHHDLTLRGQVVCAEGRPGKRPGVLVVHEAWGLDEHAIEKAGKVAELGYVALAVDMFDEAPPAGNDAVFARTRGLRENPMELRARIRAAYDTLASRPEVDPQRMASIGYCFGGTTSLELARSGAPVAGVVSFHGTLSTASPVEPDSIRAKILVCTGADDPFIPLDQVQAFLQEMKQANADAQVILYSGAAHSFTNPGAGERGIPGLAYNRLADERSWRSMVSFLAEAFGD
jgi:dienelactone hydrolase